MNKKSGDQIQFYPTLREKCPNMEFFFWSVYSFLRTEYGDLRRFSPYTEKYGPEKTPYLDTFHELMDFIIE